MLHLTKKWEKERDKLTEHLGQQALLNLFIHIPFLIIVWWALQSFRFEFFLSEPKGPRAKTLMILLTVAIAHLVSSFFISYLNWSRMLRFLF